MAVSDTATTWIGIKNEHGFYSHHYLSEVFSGDIKETLSQWLQKEKEEEVKTPYNRLKALHIDYFSSNEKIRRERSIKERITLQRSFFQQLISVLGYEWDPQNLTLDDHSEVPILALVGSGSNAAPGLIILGG